MKINPEISSVINLVKKDSDYQKKSEARGEEQKNVEDIVSVENKVASRSDVENVEEARVILSDVMKEIDRTSSSVHNLNTGRISQLIS